MLTGEQGLALTGGILIGGAAALLLAGLGQIAGISSILRSVLTGNPGEGAWRWYFIAGLMLGSAFLIAIGFRPEPVAPKPFMHFIGGVCVGVGARLCGGCTSGHGVCGMGRLSKRSWVAVPLFMLVGMLTVTAMRMQQGGLGW